MSQNFELEFELHFELTSHSLLTDLFQLERPSGKKENLVVSISKNGNHSLRFHLTEKGNIEWDLGLGEIITLFYNNYWLE